jgi:hypothetical protein
VKRDFFFHFFGIEMLAKFNKKIANSVEFTLGKKDSKIFPISLSKNEEIPPEK